jgi:hypothetical protein
VLNIEPSIPEKFKEMICKDFTSPGSYPTYITQTVSEFMAHPRTVWAIDI